MTDMFGPLTDQLVGRRDDSTGSILLTGWAAGPAGIATVLLDDGAVELSIDYAEPGTVSQIVAPSTEDPGRSSTGAFDVLFGGAWELLESRLTSEPRILWRSDEQPLPLVHRLGMVTELGRLAILEAETIERRHTPTGLAISDIERAVITARLPDELRISPAAQGLFARGGEVLLSVGPGQIRDEMTRSGPGELDALLVEGLETIELRSADLAGRLEDLARWLRDDGPQVTAIPAAAMMPAPVSAAARSLDHLSIVATEDARVAPMTGRSAHFDISVELDPALDAELMNVNLDHAHLEVVVRCPGEQHLWLRLFRADRRPVLLAMGQMQVNDFGSASATVMVPRDVATGNLLADVTDRPEQRWAPPSVRATRRAVRHGRDACRAERGGDLDRAVESWLESAVDWRAVGDDRRTALAGRYAESQSPLQASEPTAPPRRTDRREPIEPFVLDLLDHD